MTEDDEIWSIADRLSRLVKDYQRGVIDAEDFASEVDRLASDLFDLAGNVGELIEELEACEEKLGECGEGN